MDTVKRWIGNRMDRHGWWRQLAANLCRKWMTDSSWITWTVLEIVYPRQNAMQSKASGGADPPQAYAHVKVHTLCTTTNALWWESTNNCEGVYYMMAEVVEADVNGIAWMCLECYQSRQRLRPGRYHEGWTLIVWRLQIPCWKDFRDMLADEFGNCPVANGRIVLALGAPRSSD